MIKKSFDKTVDDRGRDGDGTKTLSPLYIVTKDTTITPTVTLITAESAFLFRDRPVTVPPPSRP